MKKQSKTPLFNTIRKAFGMALAAERRQTSAEEIVQRSDEYRRSRRRFLENMGKTALAGSLVPQRISPKGGNFFSRAIAPRIAIVGGGIAGLTALHTLKKRDWTLPFTSPPTVPADASSASRMQFNQA